MTLIAAPSHKTVVKVSVPLASQAPLIAPNIIMTTLATLLSLLELSQASRFVSLAKSLYVLVKTVVGSSLNPKLLAVATCAPDWAARNGIAIKTSLSVALVSGMASAWTSTAVMQMQRAWRRKEATRVERRVRPTAA